MQPIKAEQMKFKPGPIAGVIIRELRKHTDERGWLAEIFRQDELEPEYYPVMAYISMSLPEVTRGPHEHVDQSDLFAFIGPSNFKLKMWDNRPGSPTFGNEMTILVGEDHPSLVLVPKGVTHGYKNIGDKPGFVINCANRLFKGEGRREPVDEIRYENLPDSPFQMD